MRQYCVNRKFLSIKLSKNTAKLDFMVHLKSSMEAFFKKIFLWKKKLSSSSHIHWFKNKAVTNTNAYKVTWFTPSKARQSVRQWKLVNHDLRLKIVFSVIDFPQKGSWFWICFCFYLGGCVWEKHFQNKLTKFCFSYFTWIL